MKKILLSVSIAISAISGVSAQTSGLEAGIHFGIPVGDAKEVSSFNIGLDVAYLYPVSDNFRVGGATGYDLFLTKNKFKDQGAKDLGFIPLAASAKYSFLEKFFGGLDLGYAISTTSGLNGGFYYQPKVGYFGSDFDVYASYKGIGVSGSGSNSNVNAVSLGFTYKF